MAICRSKTRWLAVLAGLTLIMLTGCTPTPGESARLSSNKAELARLAKVKKIALVTFVGKSETNPKATIHKPLIHAMYGAFQARAAANTHIVKFIPIKRVINNEAYRHVAKIKMPEGTVSPVEGLTYIKIVGMFDSGPLTKALGVDALMVVLARFGVAIRNFGSTPYLIAKVYPFLVVPPEEVVWGNMRRPMRFDELIPAAIFTHPKLMISIGAKWVIFLRPSKSEYGELMKIAIDNKSKMATEAGEAIIDNLVTSIQKARRIAASQAPSK
ncbi:MAG: hypothetical protein ACE5JU_19035 [Candidatus Binatia bacterium]